MRKLKPNALWRIEMISEGHALHRVIGPLRVQKGKRKTICVAIGSNRKRLQKIVDALNDKGVEI